MHFVSNGLREPICNVIWFQTSCRKRTAKYISLKQVAGNQLQNNLDSPKTTHTVCHYVGNLMKWFDEVNLGSLDSF